MLAAPAPLPAAVLRFGGTLLPPLHSTGKAADAPGAARCSSTRSTRKRPDEVGPDSGSCCRFSAYNVASVIRNCKQLACSCGCTRITRVIRITPAAGQRRGIHGVERSYRSAAAAAAGKASVRSCSAPRLLPGKAAKGRAVHLAACAYVPPVHAAHLRASCRRWAASPARSCGTLLPQHGPGSGRAAPSRNPAAPAHSPTQRKQQKSRAERPGFSAASYAGVTAAAPVGGLRLRLPSCCTARYPASLRPAVYPSS